MVVSRGYKDSITNSFKLFKGAHIPEAAFGTGSESYMSPDSSGTIILYYRDSAIGCALSAKDFNLLQKIISDGQIDGFTKTAIVSPNPTTVAYIKGKYLLTFSKSDRDKRYSNVSLAKNYQSFNISVKTAKPFSGFSGEVYQSPFGAEIVLNSI
jgi:hypothetical protein